MKYTVKRLFPEADFSPVDESLAAVAMRHLDKLAKPKGSLGRLEELAARLFAIAGGKTPLKVDPCLFFVAAGDHGVAARGVSPFPQIVTRQMVENFFAGGAAINVLCRAQGIDLRVVDAGCAGGAFAPHPLLLDRRQGNGAADISAGPAMPENVCLSCLRAGFELAEKAALEGYACVGAGEMGIANTTPATALFCALLQMEPGQTAGPGAGAAPAMIDRKIAVVRQALAVNASAVNSGDAVRILAALGGYEIAVIAGIMLGCASQKLPFLVDGFICSSAYAAARAIWPDIAGYAILTHCSAEPAFAEILARLDSGRPLLDLGMRLGEGSGAATAFSLLRCAAAIYNEMADLESAHVSATEQDRLD